MSVYLLVIRVEVPDHVQKLPQVAYQAPEFELKKRDRISYAEAAATVAQPITANEIKIHRGCREFTQITIETYFTAEIENKEHTEMPVVDDKKSPEPLAHAAKSVADAVAEATNTAKRHESPKRGKKFGKEGRMSPAYEHVETAAEACAEDADVARAAVVARTKSVSPTLQQANTIHFSSGNPNVETTEGIIHLYKENQRTSLVEDVRRSEMICVLAVPSKMTSRDLLDYIAAYSVWIESMKIIKESTPNKYMVLIKFSSQKYADDFYNEFNGQPFNMLESEVCHLVYVAEVESLKESEGAGFPVTNLTELPMCPVCLEKMDESVDGVLTVLCNHSFHTGCLWKWGDTSCPVCRYTQTPELAEDHRCMQCESQDVRRLWICLICGHVGCGRYDGGHAFAHFQETQHTYSMQLENKRVWDYAGDNYVHRLIQNKADGKLVEVDEGGNTVQSEKMDAIQLEISYAVTKQLEEQTRFFNSKIAKVEEDSQRRVEEAKLTSKLALEKCEKMEIQLESITKEKADLEKKFKHVKTQYEKVLKELSEERALNKSLVKNQKEWLEKVSDLEKQVEDKGKVIQDMEEQLRDVMFTLEAQHKLAEATGLDASREEIEGGQIIVGPAATDSSSKRKGRKKTR